MADPATQFQPAGLNTNTYTPVKGGDLGGSHLFGGAGQIWAGIGDTALKAAAQLQSTSQMIQASPLNPNVQAQQDYTGAQADYGQDIIDYARKTGQMGILRSRATPAGSEVLAPAEAGQAFAPLYMPKDPTGQNKNPPPAPRHAPGTGQEPQVTQPTQPEKKEEPKADDLEHPPVADVPTANLQSALASLRVPSQGGSSAVMGAGDPTQLNTGQPQDQGIQATPAPQGGSIYSPMRPSPMAPPAPGGPPPAQSPTPGTVPGSLSDQFAQQAQKEQLGQWQNQNIHPVVAPAAFLKAYKDNVTTAATDATYMPSGGPGGSPAFSIGMKGGGNSLVPLSQVAQTSWGGPLIASHNGSSVLEHQQDQQTQQDQAGAQGQPQDQPNISPPPPPNLPPPAPTGPQAAQAGPVYNPLPPAPGPNAPAAPGAYDPTAYRQAVAQATANPSNLMAQESPQAGTRTDISPVPPARTEITPLTDQERAIVTPEAIAAAQTNARPDPSQPNNAAEADGKGGDPYMGDLGPWHLYRDDKNRTGELYAVRPGLSSLFKQQRMILGSDGWREYELPDSNMRISAEGIFGGGKGGVAGAVMPNGATFNGKNTFPTMSHDQIAKLSVPAMQGWLNLAGKYYNTTGEANSTMDQRFSGLMDMGQRTQRLLDGQEVATRNGMPSESYSREAQGRSSAARERDALKGRAGTTSWNPAELANDALNAGKYNSLNNAARGESVNPFSDYLEEQVRRMNDAESQLPGRQLAVQKPGSSEGTSVTASGYGLSGTLKLGSGDQTSRSPHLAVNRLFENAPHDEARDYLLSHKAEINRQFEQTYNDAVNHNYRLNPDVIAYHNLITKGATGSELDKPNAIDAAGNRFRDANGNLINPWPKTGAEQGKLKQELTQSGAIPRGGPGGPGSRPATTGNPSPTPTPVVRTPADLQAFKKKYPPGTPFVDTSGNPHTYQ